MDNIINTDSPLSPEQKDLFVALLDTILPASEDGRMPSAGELDVTTYVQTHDPDFLTPLVEGLAWFDGEFASLPAGRRHELVEDFNRAQPALFDTLLFNTYACYYQDDQVLTDLGLAGGAPFPRGREVSSGDLSLLDPVLARAPFYRV